MRDFGYEMCGSGPVLLVVPGGAGHPMGLGGLVDRLRDRFTVVTYDPIGLSHGTLDGRPVEDQKVQVWSENAHRLLDSLLPAGESAYVFGSSSGAIAALDLLARHPERLRRVVAHEPPVVEVLPDAVRHRAMFAEVYELYRTHGMEAAALRLNAGLSERSWVHPPATAGRAPDAGTTPMALFVTRVLCQFTAYEPDSAVLKASADRLALAYGRDSRDLLLHRTGATLAGQLGSALTEFPGGHLGAIEHPAEFAERLAETLLPVGTPRVPLTT